MIRSLYHQILRLAAGPAAPWWLFGVAFAEASFFPIPPDALLAPMVLARPHRAWVLAALCTLGSLAGAALGYAIGAVFFEHVARPLLNAYHAMPVFLSFQAKYAQYGFRLILLKGLTPIPFKIVTIASGAAHFALGPFFLACLITRATRFFLVAALLRVFGDQARLFMDRYLNWVLLAALVALIGGFLLLRYV